ncbi:MAG: polyprenyl synthetase family protein [Clostridia bacterium]|nr:polyprenyl synthetase family protein [Clostridia bacterium]
MELKEELSKYREIIDTELAKYLTKEKCPEQILNEAMEYSLMAGGKRIRPILMLKVYQLFREEIEKVMSYACAMEMIHNFSLIHDDLPGIDDDDFRHGKLTNHKKYNEATAILAGDGLLNLAYGTMTRDLIDTNNMEEQKNKIKAINEIITATQRMIAGEYVDTEYEGKAISSDYLEYMHKNKTGALFIASARSAAILANANEAELEKITKYAEIIGLTFQIKDDILSAVGDENILGKQVGNDAERGKCTYVTKYGLEKAKKMLEELTKEAVEIAETYEEKGEFLKELAIYIKIRNK